MSSFAKIPFTLPFVFGGEGSALAAELKKSVHGVYRRMYFRRRTLDGEYETEWQLIPEGEIIKYGTISQQIDALKVNFFHQSGVTIELDNTNGRYSLQDFYNSFWADHLPPYRALIKIEAGYYLEETGTEVPQRNTLFFGILLDEPKQKFDNRVTMTFQPMTRVLDELDAGKLALSSIATVTAYNLIGLMRDYVDSNGIAIHQKFISLGAWEIDTTTSEYTQIDTTTVLDGDTCFDVLTRLAEAEDKVFFFTPDGKFKFTDRTEPSVASYDIIGGSKYLENQAHTLIKIDSYQPATKKVYNRVRIKIGEDDTSTSYYTKEEEWAWGDSSSSYMYGVKTYEIDNDWMNTATAAERALDIFNQFRYPRNEIRLTNKFIPDLDLLDLITVSFTVYEDDRSLWGASVWGGTFWMGSDAHHFEFEDEPFQVIEIKQDVDNFTTEITGRATA